MWFKGQLSCLISQRHLPWRITCPYFRQIAKNKCSWKHVCFLRFEFVLIHCTWNDKNNQQSPWWSSGTTNILNKHHCSWKHVCFSRNFGSYTNETVAPGDLQENECPYHVLRESEFTEPINTKYFALKQLKWVCSSTLGVIALWSHWTRWASVLNSMILRHIQKQGNKEIYTGNNQGERQGYRTRS